MKSRDALISFARESLGISSSDRSELIALSGRGSDRSYYRFNWGIHSVIVVQYESNRVENSYFADIAEFLYVNGIPVPRMIRHDAANGRILLEDLGGTDLWMLRDAPWEQRQMLYRKTLSAAHMLHSIPESQFPSDRIRLTEPFGPSLYRWERNYFLENFVIALCNIQLDVDRSRALETELSALADKLSSGKRCLVHRDLQSQNVMICGDRPFLIDFQGMRFGTLYYDLGSLLCDPYVDFTGTERMELLSYYYNRSDQEVDWDGFAGAFWQASAQRLMQALGAYGFLALKKGLQTYLAHVPNGLRNLRTAAENAHTLPLLRSLCDACEMALAAQSRAADP
ncbi:MAG TPA: phosphotransferase [Acidobacteriota bacterium]|nr:phosphotransferase [Acidobacteriota bacterium]